MLLSEITSTGLRYKLNANTSVTFKGDRLPKADELGKWSFHDEQNFDVLISGKFKDAVKKATDSYKHLKATGFSHNLTVKKADLKEEKVVLCLHLHESDWSCKTGCSTNNPPVDRDGHCPYAAKAQPDCPCYAPIKKFIGRH